MNTQAGSARVSIAVLIVEDSESDALLMVRQLEQAGFDVRHRRVESEDQLQSALRDSDWDIVLSDFNVPGFGAAGALALVKSTGLDIPFVVVSGAVSEETAVELMRAGACDYLMKDHPARLAPAVTRELAEAVERRERRRADAMLIENSEFYSVVMDSSPDGIVSVGADGLILAFSVGAQRMFGYAAAEAIGRPLTFLMPDSMRSAHQNKFDRKAKDFQSPVLDRLVEGLGLRKNGDAFPVSIALSQGAVGGRWMVTAIIRDISSQRRREEEVRDYVGRLELMTEGVLQAVVRMGELRDPYTAGHSNRVGELAAAIGRDLGLPTDMIKGLRFIGTVHDIGKIGVPLPLLSRSEPLSDDEFEQIKGHILSGYEILRRLEFPWPLAEVVLQHHERLDGSGYPRGLKGAEILLEARIIAVADVVESMTSARPYRSALGLDVALDEILKHRGRLFDAEVVNACVRLFREKGYTMPPATARPERAES